MTQIELVFHVGEDGSLSVINQTKDALVSLQTTAEQAGGAGGSGGLGSLVSGAANAYGAFQMMSGALTQAGGMISSVVALGEESRKANLALDTLSGGNSGAFLSAGRDATKGLVDDLGLAQMATDGLARGAFTTSAQFAQIARDGAVLGSALGTDATAGVNNLQVALEHVGQVRSLQSLGLDVQTVDAAYKKFISEGIDKTTAWRDAVMGAADDMTNKLGPAIDNGPGAATAKLTVAWNNFKASFAERVSIGVDGIAGMLSVLNDPKFTKMLEYQIAGPTSPNAPAEGSIATGAGGSGGVLGNAMKGMFDNTDWSAFFPSNGSAADGGMAGLPGAGSSTNFTPGQASQSSYYSPQGQAYQNLDIQWDINNLRHGSDAQDRLNKNTSAMDPFGGNSNPMEKAAEATANAATTLSLKAASAAREDDTRLIQTRSQAVQDATQKEKDHAASINSVASAFGLNQNGLYGQVGSTADQGVAAARAAELSKDQHKGMGAAATAADMSSFDKTAQAAQDSYALSTGAATKESLAFRDAQTLAAKSLADGKMTVTDYYKEMLQLANAAKTGKASLSDISAIVYGANSTDKQPGSSGHGAVKGASTADKANGPDAADPFAATKSSADKATTSVTALQTSVTTVDTNISNLAGAMPTYAKNIAAGITPAQTAIDKVVTVSKVVNDMWSKMSGTWSVNVNFTAGGNSRAGVQNQ